MLLVPVNCLELMSIVQTRFPDSSLGIADGIYLGSRNELCFILFGRYALSANTQDVESRERNVLKGSFFSSTSFTT